MWTAAVLSVGWLAHHAVCWVAWCRLISALPRCCYALHTFSLYGGTWIEMQRSFLSMCFTRLPSPITADHYHYSRRVGIGRDTQTDISHSPILQRFEYSITDIRYRSNTSMRSCSWYINSFFIRLCCIFVSILLIYLTSKAWSCIDSRIGSEHSFEVIICVYKTWQTPILVSFPDQHQKDKPFSILMNLGL